MIHHKHRLKNSRVYISGPIDYAKDFGITWRKNISSFLRTLDVVILDPTNKPVEGCRESSKEVEEGQRLKKLGLFNELSNVMRQIRSTDLRMCDICDWAIVYYDVSTRMTGTLEELFLLNSQKKPVLLFCPQGIVSVSNWLFGTIPYKMMFDKWVDLKTYINYINSNVSIDDMGRWRFFDLS